MARKPSAKDRPPSFRGPVADLESHLPSEWWRELFDSLYLKTDGDVVENDANTAREIDLLIETTGIQHQDRLLDLCCGQGRHSIELTRRGHPVTLLDPGPLPHPLAASTDISKVVRMHEFAQRCTCAPENDGFSRKTNPRQQCHDRCIIISHINLEAESNGTLR